MKVLRIYHAGRDSAHRERERALHRAGVDLTLVVPTAWPGPDVVGDEPFDIVQLDVLRPGDVNRHRFVDALQIGTLIRQLRPDVVDVHEEPFSSVMHQVLDAVPITTPVVSYTAQNIDKRFPPPFAQWEKSALARLDGLYPCSRQAASVAVGKGFAGPVEVLPLAPARQFTAGEQTLPGAPLRLLLVGRFVPEKGVLDAVRAAAIVSKGWPVVLTIVGEGPEESPARGLAAQLGVRLEVRPWLGADELAIEYRRAHILLAPSRTTSTWVEQFGRMVIEAQASGAVVVAYDSGSLPEVIGGAGVLVETGDAIALGGAVAHLISEPERWTALRDAGRTQAAGITWDAVAAGQVRLYEQAMEPHAHLPVRSNRPHARELFGESALTRAGQRPFALPVLRDKPVLSRPLASLADRLNTRSSARESQARLRVVYLDHVARMSGGELALVRLISSLPNIEAHVILGEHGPLQAALEKVGATVEVLELDPSTRDLHRTEIGGASAAARTAAYVLRLARRLTELEPDVVHTNSLKSGYYGSLAAKLAGVPCIWHLRDRISEDYLPSRAITLTRRLLSSMPDLVICNSAATQQTIGRARSVVVHGAVVHDAYAPTRPPRQTHDGLRVIGIVGRLAHWKGQDVVIRAVARLRTEGSDVTLRVIGSAMFGEDDYAASLHALAAELGVQDAVEFTGQVDDVEIELATLDVLVHASRVPEPFGQVVVEGMAAGLPVIATAPGGPAEIITDDVDGLLVPPEDVDALCEALRSLDCPDVRAALAAAAVERAADFGPDVLGPRLQAIYESVAAQGGRRRRR